MIIEKRNLHRMNNIGYTKNKIRNIIITSNNIDINKTQNCDYYIKYLKNKLINNQNEIEFNYFITRIGRVVKIKSDFEYVYITNNHDINLGSIGICIEENDNKCSNECKEALEKLCFKLCRLHKMYVENIYLRKEIDNKLLPKTYVYDKLEYTKLKNNINKLLKN